MKARKFFKKLISIRWIVAILIVLCLGIVATVYFTVGLSAHTVDIENMPFDREGFVDFNGKKEEDVNQNYVVGENDEYKMFFDENTTIVTMCVKDTLKVGRVGNKPDDYGTIYRSANADGIESKRANFELGYAGTNVAKPVNNSFNSYANSVKFVNGLTNEVEKHYAVKYMKKATDGYDGVQIEYTIGNFGSLNTFFAQQYYATVYKPAKVLFNNEAEWEKAVKEWEEGYLAKVGSLSNTFEERFRGNVEIPIRQTKNSALKKYFVEYNNTITVYSEDALDYILNTVFPELDEEGIPVPEVTKEDLDQEYTTDVFGNARWKIKNCPTDLLRYDSPYYKKYFNNENSPLTNNPFMTSPTYASLKGAYRAIYADNSVPYPYYKTSIKVGPGATDIYNKLYVGDQTELNGCKFVYNNLEGEEVPYTSAGFPAMDENGKFLYDEDGNLMRQLYSYEQVKKDNQLFEVDTEGLPVFKIALEFKLTDTGMVVSVPNKSIVDSSNVKDYFDEDSEEYKLINVPYYVASIKVCPNLTTVDDTQQGYMVIPDGSGAIINFNNGKTSTISANYYGKDLAYVDGVKTEDPARLLLGMFAFVNTTPENPGGLLAIIEKGGGQVSLTAGVSDKYKENFAYLNVQLRGRESVKTGTVAAPKEYDKWDKKLAPSDIVFNYQILDESETEYSTIAKKYQKYLMQRDGITEYRDKTDKVINDITFLGTFEKYDLFAGIKYKKSDTLTTFKQAMEIINELNENNVNDLSISYRGWTNEYLEYEIGGPLKVAGKLGHTAGIRSFYKFCVEKEIPFFPELSITTAKGYNYLFGSTKYSARGVGNEEAIHYSYDLATLRPDKKLSKTYVVSPQFYHDITHDLMKGFNKLKVWKEKDYGGFLLADLGNQWNGNYRKGKQIYGAEAIDYQKDSLDLIAENGRVKISVPCDYAFKYVDEAVNVPITSAMYTVYDATIPFYQLTVNGLFDYSTEQINGLSNRSSDWYFTRALESGSNISYLLSYEDPSVLLDTDYTQYYQIYYQNWKTFIIESTKILNDLGIYGCYLTNHEIVDGCSRVTYTNKTDSSKTIVLVINGTDKAKTYNGQTIPAYGFIKEA